MANNGSVWINLLMDYMDKTHLDKINEIFTKYEEKIFATNYNFDEIKNLIKQYIPEMLDSDYKILEARLNNIRQTVLDKIREAENITLSAADFQDDFSSVTEVNVVEKREKLLKAIEADITHDTPVGTEMFQEKNDAFYEHRSPYYAPTVNVSLFGDLLGLKKFIDTDVNDKTWESYIKERVKVIKFPIDSNIKVLEFGLHFTQNVYNIASNYDQIQKTNRDFTGRIYLSNLLEEDKAIECRLIIYNADNDPWRKTDNTVGPEFYFKCFRKDGFIYLFCDKIEIFRMLGIWKKNSSHNFQPDLTTNTGFDTPDVSDEDLYNGYADQPGRGETGFDENIKVAWLGSVVPRTKTVNNININSRMQPQKASIAARNGIDFEGLLGDIDAPERYKNFSNFDLFVRNRTYQARIDKQKALRYFGQKHMWPLDTISDADLRIYVSFQGRLKSNVPSIYGNTNRLNAAVIYSINKSIKPEDDWNINEIVDDPTKEIVAYELPYIYTSEQISYSPVTGHNGYVLPSKAEKKWTYIEGQRQALIHTLDVREGTGKNISRQFVNYPCSVMLMSSYEKDGQPAQTNEQYHYIPILMEYSQVRKPLRIYDFEVVQANNSHVDYAWLFDNMYTKTKCKLEIELEQTPENNGYLNNFFADNNRLLIFTKNDLQPISNFVLTVDEPTPNNIIKLEALPNSDKFYEDENTTGRRKYRIQPATTGTIPRGNVHIVAKVNNFYNLPVQKEILLTCKSYSKLNITNLFQNSGIKLSADNTNPNQKYFQKLDIEFNSFTFEYKIRDLDIIEFDKETRTVKGLKPGFTILTLSAKEDGFYYKSEYNLPVLVVEDLILSPASPDRAVEIDRDDFAEHINPYITDEERYAITFIPKETYWDVELQQIDEVELEVEEDYKTYTVRHLFEGKQLIDKRYNYLLAYFDHFNVTVENPESTASYPNIPGNGQIIIEEYMKWTPSTIEMIGKRLFVYFVKTDKTSYYKKPIGGFEKSFFPYEEMLENYLFLNGRKIDITAYPEYEPLYNAYKEARYLTEEGEAHDTYLELDIPETTLEEPLVINRYQSKEILVTSNAHDYTITNDPANANFVTNAKLTDKFGFTLTGAAIGSQKLIIKATSTSGSTVTKEVFVKCIEENLTYIDSLVEQIIINGVNGGFNSKIVHFYTDAEYTGSNGNTFTATGMQNGVTVSEWKDNGPILAKGPNGEELRDISFKIYYPFNAAHAFPQKQNITISVKNEVAKKKINSYVVDLRITKETPSFGFLTPTRLTTELLTCDDNIYSWPEELTVNKQHVIWFIECINPENYVNYDYYCEVTATNPNAIQVTKHNEVDFTLTPLQKGFNTVTWKLTKDDIVYKKTLQFKCKELTELSTSLDTDNIELWPAKNTVIDVITNANDFTFEVKDVTKATAVKVNNQLSITSLDIGSTELVIKATADDGIQNTLTIPINVVPVPHTRLEVDVTELTLDLGFNQRLTIDTEAEEWEYEILSGADYLNLVKTNDTTLVVQATEIGESRIKIKAQHGELVESSIEIPVTVKYVDTELSIGTRTEYEILKDETLVFEITTNAADFTYIEDVDLVETPDTENPDVENPDGQDPDQEQQPEQEIKKKRLKFTKGRGKLTVQGINPGNQKFSVSATATNGDTKTIEVTIDVFEEATTFEISPESTKRILKLGETQIFTINNSANDYTVIIPDDVKDCLSYDKAKHTLSCTKVCDTTLTFEAKEDGKKKIVKEVKVSANYPFADLNLTEDQIKSRVENLDQLFIDLHTNRTNREEYNKVIDKLKNSFPEANFIVDEESVPAFQLSETTKATLEKYKTTVPTLEEYNNEIQEYYNAMPRSLNLSVDDITLNNLKTLNDASVYINDAAQCTSVKKHNDQLSTLLKNTTKWRFVDHSYKSDVFQRMYDSKIIISGTRDRKDLDEMTIDELTTLLESFNTTLTKLRNNHRDYFTLKNYSEFKNTAVVHNYMISPVVILKGEILDEDGNPPDQLSGKSVSTFDTKNWVEYDYISEITMTNSNPDVVDVEVAENLKSITFTHKNAGKGESDVEFTLKRVVEIYPTELEVDKDNLEFTLIAPPKKEEIVTPEEGDGSETNPDIDGGEQEVNPPIESDPVDQPTEEETVEQESQTITFTTNAPTFILEAEDPDQDIVEIVIETDNPDVKAAKITPLKEGTVTLIAKATAVSEIPTTEYREATIEINITVNPPVEEVIPPTPEVPTPDPDQGELTPDQGTEETPEVSPDGGDVSEPQVQADEGTDEGPVVDGGTDVENPNEIPEEPESKIETVEYTQTINVRVLCLQDINTELVFEELFNKNKKFTLYKYNSSEIPNNDEVLKLQRAYESIGPTVYNMAVIEWLMKILFDEYLDSSTLNLQYTTGTSSWPIYKLLPDVELDVDDTKTEEELIDIAYDKVLLSAETTSAALKAVAEWNRVILKNLNTYCQNVANKDEFIKENVLYKGAKMDTSTTSIDNAGREHNLSLVNNIINKYKNEFTNASEIKYTGKLYHILATGTWDPVIVKKNRHQLMSIEMCYKNILPKHIEFKLLDSKDMKKINTKKIYANEVWFDHDDLGEDLLPFGLDPEYETPEKQLSCGLDLQSVLDYIYLKYSGDDKVSLINTSDSYRVNMKYRASDFAYDVGGTDNNKKNVMVAVTRLIKSLLHNNNDQTKNETKVDIDIFEKPTNGQATDIYFEDKYRIGVNTVGDLIKWMNDNKDLDFKFPYMDSRDIQAYRLDPRYIDTPEGEKIYDTNGRKCFYSEDLEVASRANRGVLTYPKIKWYYSEEDVLPYGIDIEDGGWVSKKSYDSSVAFLFSNKYPHTIFRSTDGFHWQELTVREKGVDLWMDEHSYFEDLQVNHDGSFVVLVDAQARLYCSVDMPRAGEEVEGQEYKFKEVTDATYNTSGARYSMAVPLNAYWQKKGGYGVAVAYDGHPALWKDNMRHTVTHLKHSDSQTFPRQYNHTSMMAPNFTFDLKSINSNDSVGTRHMTYTMNESEKILHDPTGQPLVDGMNNLVDSIYNRSAEGVPVKFGIDFELLLSLSDTSVFSTDYDFEILNRGEVIDLIPTEDKDKTTFEIKSGDLGIIQLDGFEFSGAKVNKTGPYVIKKQFMNFYVDPAYTLNRIVNKNSTDFIKTIKDYLNDRITMTEKDNALVMIEMTSIFDLPVTDERRKEIDKNRLFYNREFYQAVDGNGTNPTTRNFDYSTHISVDGLKLTAVGVYDKDEAKSRFARYYVNLARFRNLLRNAYFTMEELRQFYNLDYDVLKKIFFADDDKIKLSEMVLDPFKNLDDTNIFKYPVIVNVTIYPTDVQSFVNYRQKINRDLYNKYEKDGDIITTKTDILFNKEE